MHLDRRVRWAVGLLGSAFVAMAAAMAWVKPDGTTVVGFLTAGVVLLLVALLPRLPTKIGIGGGSLEYPAEELVDREYTGTLEHELWTVIGTQFREQHRDVPPEEAFGTTSGPGLDYARQLARRASTRDDLNEALETARNAAREQALSIVSLLEAARNSPRP